MSQDTETSLCSLLLVLSYNDTGLSPYTAYTYHINASNNYGFTVSPSAVFRTPAGVPTGDLVLNVTNVLATSADFSWNAIANTAGEIGMSLCHTLTLTLHSDRRPYIPPYHSLQRDTSCLMRQMLNLVSAQSYTRVWIVTSRWTN